jgi:hypothetical protein
MDPSIFDLRHGGLVTKRDYGSYCIARDHILICVATVVSVAVEKVGSKTAFPQGEFLLVYVFLPAVCFLRGCHRWLRSLVEEPHQSFQVLCHGS